MKQNHSTLWQIINYNDKVSWNISAVHTSSDWNILRIMIYWNYNFVIIGFLEMSDVYLLLITKAELVGHVKRLTTMYLITFTVLEMNTICFSFLVTSVTVAVYLIQGIEANCHSYDIYESHKIPGGRYCPTEGTALFSDLTIRQCKYLCLQSANCAAFNHNTADDKYAFLHKPCPLANGVPGMEYFIFTEKPSHQCFQWVPYASGDALDDRMIASQIGALMVSRIMYNGNNIIGYQYIPHQQCFTYTTVDDQIVSSSSSAPCERLRIADDCTAFWVPYRAGDPLPARAVTGGLMASGEVGYAVKFDILHNSETVTISGYYTEGASHAISAYYGFRDSNTMMMLVIL